MDKPVVLKAVRRDDIDVDKLARALIMLVQDQSKPDTAPAIEEVTS